MSLLTNPLVLRAALLLFGAIFAFGLGLFLMRLLRKAIVSESENIISNSLEESSKWRKDNHMKHTKLMAVVTLLMVSLGTASAQSLGDYARTARKNKAEPSPTSRHYDNDNLPTSETLSVVGQSPAANTAAPVPAEASKGTEQKAAADQPKAAEDLTKKIQEQQEKINSLNREIDLDQREQRLRAASYYTDAGTRLRNPGQWNKDQAQDINDAADKQKAVEAARQKLEQMQEEARKSGIAQKEKDADSKQQ